MTYYIALGENMISGSFGYADIAIIAIVGLLLLLCTVRGFSKSFNGLLCAFLAIVISLLVVGAFTDKVMNTGVGNKLETKLEEQTSKWGVPWTNPARKDADGNVEVQVDGTWVNVSEAGGNKITVFIVSKIAPRLVSEELGENQTMAGNIVHGLATIIIAACFFVACIIVLAIIFAILRHITEKMSEANKGGKAVDKILGLILSLGVSLMVIWTALAILDACAGIGPTQSIIDGYIKPCTLANFFYEHNYIGVLFRKIFVG